MSRKYENELKGILTGDEDKIDNITKTMDQEKTEAYRLTIDRPFAVVRGAGSLGIDLTAMRYKMYLPIEVKSSGDDTLYFTDTQDLQEQIEDYKEAIEQSHIPLLYAYRLKGVRGEKWTLYRLHGGRRFDIIPKMKETRNDNLKMEFQDGLPLSEFLRQVLSA